MWLEFTCMRILFIAATWRLRIQGLPCVPCFAPLWLRDPELVFAFPSQAYGAEHYSMLGLTLQRGLLICGTFIIIGLPFWLHIEPLLILCGAPT